MSFLPRESSMEVDHDPPAGPSGVGSGGTLKRSNSAPMINVLVSQAETHSDSEIRFPHSPPLLRAADTTRIRRFSSSSMCLNSPPVTNPIKIPDRVNRLKAEEIHIEQKEKQHEKEVSSALRMSTSWDQLTLEEPMMSEQAHKRPRSFSESLHVFTSPHVLPGAPSPTRVGKQCFSPSMQIAVTHSFTPSPSPSPTRKSFMRSLSPIAVRPSPSGKRKLETDTDCCYISPAKKFHHSGPSTPDRIIAHPLAHSVSSSSLEDGSPDQIVPRGELHVRTQSRPQPQMYGFMPLNTESHTDMQTTDSETSDINESTDISDHNLSSMSGSPGTSGNRGFQPVVHQGHHYDLGIKGRICGDT